MGQAAGRLDEIRTLIGGLASQARIVWQGGAGGVAVVAIDTGRRGDSELLLVDEASGCGFEIREREAAEVPSLLAFNGAEADVLLIDGDLLVGGFQDRVCNVTRLVCAGASVSLPVSCVEAGRWGGRKRGFGAGDGFTPPSLRRNKERSAARRRRRMRRERRERARPRAAADAAWAAYLQPAQHEVWDGVGAVHACLSVASPTGSLADAYTEHKRRLERLHEAFELPAELCADGLAVLRDGRLVAFDLLESPDLLRRFCRRSLRSLALEAIAQRGGEEGAEADREATEREIRLLLEALATLREDEIVVANGPCAGEEVVLDGARVAGKAAVLGDRLLALSVFRV